MNMYEKDRQQAIELLKEMGMSDIAKKINTKEETTIFSSDTEAEREKCLDILKSTNGKEKKSKNTFYTYFGDFYGKSENIDIDVISIKQNQTRVRFTDLQPGRWDAIVSVFLWNILVPCKAL